MLLYLFTNLTEINNSPNQRSATKGLGFSLPTSNIVRTPSDPVKLIAKPIHAIIFFMSPLYSLLCYNATCPQ